MGKTNTNLQKPEVVERLMKDESLTAEELRVWIAITYKEHNVPMAVNLPADRVVEIRNALDKKGYGPGSGHIVREITDYILERYLERYKVKPSWGNGFFIIITKKMAENRFDPQLVREAWDVWMSLEKAQPFNHHPKVWISNFWFDYCLVEAIKRRERSKANVQAERPRTREQLAAHQARKYSRRGMCSGDDSAVPRGGLSTLSRALDSFLQSKDKGGCQGVQT